MRDNTTFPRRHFDHGSHGVVEVFRGENLGKNRVFLGGVAKTYMPENERLEGPKMIVSFKIWSFLVSMLSMLYF